MAYILFASAAILMALIWAAYLRKIDIYHPERWSWVSIAIVAGGFTVIPVFLWDLPEFNASQHNTFIGHLLYYTWNVGFMEEISKFAGFLLIWVVLHRVLFREAPNYIIYGSLIALGFATVENFKYFEKYGVQLVYLRGMMSTFSHMVGTSIVVAFFYFGVRKGIIQCIFYTIAGLVLASIEHGLYDTFLSYKIGGIEAPGLLLNLIVYLIGVEIYIRLLNNFLNMSVYFDPKKCLDRKLVQRLLFFSFFLAGSIQLVALIAQYGITTSIKDYTAMILMEVGFTIILITRMSRFTFMRGKWFPIYPLLPVTFRTVPVYNPDTREVESSSYLVIRGDEFNEYPYTKNLYQTVLLSPLLPNSTRLGAPMHATMIDKVFLENDQAYYLMEVKQGELNFEGKHPTRFLLKPKVRGVIHIDKQPISGFNLLPPGGFNEATTSADLDFVEYVILESVNAVKKPRTHLIVQFLR